jgi:hypothetical protein
MNYPLLPSFCAYLDILGFKKAIEEAYANKVEQKLLVEIVEALDQSAAELKDVGERFPTMAVKFFTDNVIVGCRQRLHLGTELGFLCVLLAKFQLEMACKGFFIRGGISIGTLAINDNIVFGNALLEAHRLESTQARNPRVVFDVALKSAVTGAIETKPVNANKDFVDASNNTLNALIKCDVDNHFFVNYLWACFEPGFKLGLPPQDWRTLFLNENIIAAHRSQVECKLKEKQSEPDIWAKYFWVANYHNWFCDSVEKSNHKIEESLLRPKLTGLLKSEAETFRAASS